VLHHHDALELCAPVRLPLRAQQNFAVAGTDRSTRHVERRAPHRVCDDVERDAMATQRLFGDLDGDLVTAGAHQLGLGHIGRGHDAIAQSLAVVLQHTFARGPRDRDLQLVVENRVVAHHRTFGLDGEGIDAIDRVLDLREGTIDGIAGDQLRHDVA
jgi:hypothetical protein